MRLGLQELSGILARENGLLQTAAGYSEEKREAVIKGDIKKLESLVQFETACLEELKQLESARMQCTQALAQSLGLDEADATLEALCSRLDDSEREPLLKLHGHLKASVGSLMQLNRLNEKLIALQLRQIGIMINTLTQPPANTYTGQGTMDEKPGKKQGVFDFTV
ncbi:MAG: flagellar protein FlgN [Bacillota bacterium]